ncbi:type I restriction endonuclease subunit R [Bacteroides acidifaciens]|jgi:type I restriction enzyme R subunit|uniref:type I restriction endonuclease subunit R n=2 Tax=Bacteroides acidifaciens TaxID=85831 RepID=UPI00259822D5|nr:type I restriction endonuclease subunit R [Bacteroides acidifaciens]
MTQSEEILEQGLIKTLKEMSYEYISIKEEENLYANFKLQLEKHNRKELALHGREHFTDAEFDKILLYLEGGTRFEKAQKLRDLKEFELENGERVWIEFLNKHQWCQNEFQVSNQITVEGRKKCRYDVTILINGLPLVQIELKRRGVELKEAYNQIQRYHKTSFHGLFDYVQLFVISNGINTRYFANNPNSGYKFTFNWTDAQNVPFNDLRMFACSFLEKCNLGKMISKYIVLHEGDKCLMVLRPYQFYAVEQILDRVQNTNKNGYVWHTTGAGKTLTSFKAAQLVSEIDGIDKVLFVVDRHDLDTQTQSEYEAFEPGAVDNTDNTYKLIKRLSGDSKIIITTIQKLNCAVTRDYYNKHLQEVRNQKVIMIFDECHRSHFGDCHKNIVKFFNNLQIFGFTGTPIFAENAKQEHTTAEVFGDCLHRYLIKDAIADGNVLGFLVEYYKGQQDTDLFDEKRMTEIAQFILNNFNKSTFDGEYNALFAVQSVPMLLKYYKIFKSLNPRIKIGAVFTFAANESQDDNQTGMNQGFENENVTADELQNIMDDYNAMFDTAFTTDNFNAYYDDINLRMKKKKPDMEPLDLLLVVGMFLTGFDAKKLNTLYVDKNLEWHGLIQAFSRTNRVLNEKKRFGKIVCFRDLKEKVDAAVKLFSNNNPNEFIIRETYDTVKRELNELAIRFKEIYPDVQSVDLLKSEYDKRDFVLAFREIIKKHAEIQIYEDFEPTDCDFVMSEQEFADFKSKYLDITVGVIIPTQPTLSLATDVEIPYGDDRTLDDIDFCLELLHSDVINVAYILELIADLNPDDADYQQKRQNILDTMIKDAVMRNKSKLIDDFIRENVDNNKSGFKQAKTDGSMDLESRLNNYIITARNNAVHELASAEGIEEETLTKFISEYDYLQREKPEIIQTAIRAKKGLKLMERTSMLRRITDRLREIINTFNWD